MSSLFTQVSEAPAPLIGALLRMPVDRVRRHILQTLHAHGFTDPGEAHFQVLRLAACVPDSSDAPGPFWRADHCPSSPPGSGIESGDHTALRRHQAILAAGG